MQEQVIVRSVTEVYCYNQYYSLSLRYTTLITELRLPVFTLYVSRKDKIKEIY